MKVIHYVGGSIQEAVQGGTLTGSYHIIEITSGGKQYKLLLDIGNHPSNVDATQISNPFEHMDVQALDAVFISHAHQDHIGNCIQLVKAGYTGPIYMSEMTKNLARVIFDDSLKHEKEEVEEYNRKIEKLKQELQEAWYAIRAEQHTPETRKSNNPHGIAQRYAPTNRYFNDKVDDILREFAIKKTKYRRRLKEIMNDRNINEGELLQMLHEIPVHQKYDEEKFISNCLALKREIMDSRHHRGDMSLDEAKRRLSKYNIEDMQDIYDLDDRLAVMEFNENDVLQALSQIRGLPTKTKTTILPGIVDLTLYKAGHVEGAMQSVWNVYEDNQTKTFMYTGDLGRLKQPTLAGKPDIVPEELDYVITEGTYAGRTHNDRLGEVAKILKDINDAKDMCLLPVFALQRMQDVISMLVESVKNGQLKLNPGEKIYCHSPLGYNLTKEMITHDTHGAYTNCSQHDIIEWIERPEEVLAVKKRAGRRIIVCSGGMLERGTVTQYIDLVHNNPAATVILSGFQVPGTNGYKILHSEFDEPVFLNNKVVSKNLAHISNYPLSGHADHDELKAYLLGLHYKTNGHITIVHGGPQRHILAQDIKDTNSALTVNVPDENGMSFEM